MSRCLLSFTRYNILPVPCRSTTGINRYLLNNKTFAIQSIRTINHEDRHKPKEFSFPYVKIYGSAIAAIIVYYTVSYIAMEMDRELMEYFDDEVEKQSIAPKWKLLDAATGKELEPKDFLGKWCVILLGFTRYPKTCTEQLKQIANVLDQLNEDSNKIQPIFITIDPNNDSKESVRDYVKKISSNWIGLTGSENQVQEATHSFRLYYDYLNEYKNENNKNKLRLYLIDPNGEFNNLIEQNQNVEEIKKFLKVHMASWNIRKDSSRRKSSNETNNK